MSEIKLNKQQLASYIWESCNDMRSDSGVDASEYKNYIFGLMFYKWLSSREEEYLKDDLLLDNYETLTNDNENLRQDVRQSIGFYICKDDLFSEWVKLKKDINIKLVSDAIVHFNNSIYSEYAKQYQGILNEFQKGLDKLGSNVSEQNKAIYKLISIINYIPTNSNDYDVFGYIYEFLMSNFASGAGKKAGEFYTPHEPSDIMARITTHYLKDRNKIKVYDPCSGSGSLLLNIGKEYVRNGGEFDNVEYYAQELKEPTYNITRMNLLTQKVKPSNINTRNNNTLIEDWPYVEQNGIHRPIIVDSVVMNPPKSINYSLCS